MKKLFSCFGFGGGKSEASIRIPVDDGIWFWAKWDPNHEQGAMVEIPLQSLKYMADQIDELAEERDRLRDTLEDARMG